MRPPSVARAALLRLALLAACLTTLAGMGMGARAAEAGFGRVSAVRVDVGPIRAQGGDAQAETLRADLLAALREAFAGRVGGRGPALVVRVRALSLNPYAGSGGRLDRGGTQTDYLDGEALLVAGDGRVLARHPQLSALPASSGGAWYDPSAERRRVAAIAAHYAGWLARALPAE